MTNIPWPQYARAVAYQNGLEYARDVFARYAYPEAMERIRQRMLEKQAVVDAYKAHPSAPPRPRS